jgi:hypothetical protein
MRTLLSLVAAAGVLAATTAGACEYTKARTAAAPMTPAPVASAPAPATQPGG